jgi:hypothetical protein
MPVSGQEMQSTLGAAEVAEINSGQVLTNVAVTTAHTRLAFLGDMIPMPSWMPLANVFSIGDVIIAFGAILIVQAAMTAVQAGAVPSFSPELAGARSDG